MARVVVGGGDSAREEQRLVFICAVTFPMAVDLACDRAGFGERSRREPHGGGGFVEQRRVRGLPLYREDGCLGTVKENWVSTSEDSPARFVGEKAERKDKRWEAGRETSSLICTQQPHNDLLSSTKTGSGRVLCEFNATEVGYPHERLLHELFEEQVRRTPSAVAISYEGRSLTYDDLNRRANSLAWYLRDHGAKPDGLVGLCVERSLEMVIGLLGILKAGAAYLPLDPNYPAERLSYMLADAKPAVLLTQEHLKRTLSTGAAEVITLDGDWGKVARCKQVNPDPSALQITSRHLAYVIYTSGSTGEPKGVAGEHRGMVNRIVAQATIGPFLEDDICCQKTSIGFVDAISEILGPLSYGRPLVIASSAAAKDAEQLVSLIEAERITRLLTVPSLAQALVESTQTVQALHRLRSWTLSGEELKGDLLERLKERLAGCTFTNLYGSSEVAADATCHVSMAPEGIRVPIGRPLANTQIYVLDHQMRPAPVGVTGQIYVGGVGIARGYLNRPGLTAERFIADPFGADSNGRLYRSGDLARWRADGTLDFLGRQDTQVKIRGFRIELGEIEAQLERHAQVREAVVIAREDVPGDKRLVAYVVHDGNAAMELALGDDRTDRSGTENLIAKLYAQLEQHIPDYMIPSAWMMLEKMPLTPNGKVDRRSLPVPDRSERIAHYTAPTTPTERILADIWSTVLRVDQVGVEDNFFRLGGHSLLATQVIVRVQSSFAIDLPIRSVFQFPTIRELAARLDELRKIRVFQELEGGGNDIETLLHKVATMPERQAQELLREIRG